MINAISYYKVKSNKYFYISGNYLVLDRSIQGTLTIIEQSYRTAGINLFGINPYLTNEFSHHYQLDESTFNFRGIRSDF